MRTQAAKMSPEIFCSRPDAWCVSKEQVQRTAMDPSAWGNHANSSPGSASSKSFAESAALRWRDRAGLAGGSSLCSYDGFTAVLSTCERGKMV